MTVDIRNYRNKMDYVTLSVYDTDSLYVSDIRRMLKSTATRFYVEEWLGKYIETMIIHLYLKHAQRELKREQRQNDRISFLRLQADTR